MGIQTLETAGLRPGTVSRSLTHALQQGDPLIVFQPIVDLSTGAVTAYEALSRFPNLPGVPPDKVFELATTMGQGFDLEMLAVIKALERGARRPAGTVLSVNLSPSAFARRELRSLLPQDLSGVQIEITEHEAVPDMDELVAALAFARLRGARIAVDDVGDGHAGLTRIMALSPDVLKLDRTLVSSIHEDPAKAALAEAIVRFAHRTGSEVCAEGIESAEEAAVLADLDVAEGQGWFIGRPEHDFRQASAACVEVCHSAMDRAVTHEHTAAGAGGLVPALARIAASVDLGDLAAAMHDLAPALGAHHVELSYLDPGCSYVEAVVGGPEVFKGVHYQLADFPLTRRVLDLDVAAQVVLGTDGADPHESAWMQEDGVGSLLMVPVRSAGRVVGLLECHQIRRVPWRRGQIHSARIASAVCGPVLTCLLP
jgi:EAL domain-containing protein (putative c-di-GMP-specific phosphodiesterase class I)